MKLAVDVDAEDRKIGDVLVDANGKSVRIIPELRSHGCSGCFYLNVRSHPICCDPIRDNNGKIGCSPGNFIFKEVK